MNIIFSKKNKINKDTTNKDKINKDKINKDTTNKDKIQIPIKICNESNSDELLHVNNLVITRKIDGSTNKFIDKITNLNLFHNFILVVDFHNGGGGTTFFLNTIVSKYKSSINFLIVRNIDNQLVVNINEDYLLSTTFNEIESLQFLESIKHKIIKIFVNHTLFHRPTFLNKLFQLNKEVTTITHDMYLLFNVFNPLYSEIPTLDRSHIDINLYDQIITQNKCNLHIYSKYITDLKKVVICPLPDYKFINNTKIQNLDDNIVIGIIGAINSKKGQSIVEYIIKYYEKEPLVEVIIFGTLEGYTNAYSYNTIVDLNNLIIKYKPNLFIETSVWPETYSYTLSLMKLTNLPIIYIKKKLPFDSVIENRLLDYEKAYKVLTMNEITKLITKIKQDYFYTIKPEIYYPEFWSTYFNYTSNTFKYNIKPYFIYFPQFHEFLENNTAYYEGFSDIKNLYLLSKFNSQINIETPLLKYLEIDKTIDYNLTNKNILQKQINLISSYNFPGFALYYYWFSSNNISGKNMLMNDMIDLFFNSSIDLKDRQIFFIWANEDWHKNAAFGNTDMIIKNEYTEKNILKNVNNLMKYFIHSNYLKIDNKPVLFIHHPQQLIQPELSLFKNIINQKCIDNGFSGINLVLNSQTIDNPNYIQYKNNPNYKQPGSYKSQQIINNLLLTTLDYTKYVNDIDLEENQIQTLFFNFDNRPRLFLPNHLEKATVCINNNKDSQQLFIKKVVQTYKNASSEINQILLINAFNEWGEKMATEPSEELGYYYMNLLKDGLV